MTANTSGVGVEVGVKVGVSEGVKVAVGEGVLVLVGVRLGVCVAELVAVAEAVGVGLMKIARTEVSEETSQPATTTRASSRFMIQNPVTRRPSELFFFFVILD
jgi:hypothetical protein